MENVNQPSAGEAAQPQPGGLYQYQPGLGFVQVQAQAAPTAQGEPAGSQGTVNGQFGTAAQADATARTGMYGQGMPEGTQPKFDQNKLGQVYGAMSDVMNGEAEPAKLLGLLADTGTEFWKGALVGAAAVVLLNNDAVKGALAGAAASVGSLFREPDPEGEQVAVGGK